MEYRKIYCPMITAFNEDVKNNNLPSYITELIIISIKSLVPSENFEKVSIDYKRYNEEIKLWKNYKQGANPSLLNLFDKIDSNIYWKEKDDSIYSRILPITIVNKNFLDIKDEVIKNVLFTNGNIESLIEAILISKLIFLLINGEKNIIEQLKEEVINFSQTDFIKDYGKYYRISIGKYEKSFKISFEQKKIFAINVLNLSPSKDFPVLNDCIEVLMLNKTGKTTMGKCVKAILDNEGEENLVPDYYKELIEYLYRLRKGRISPEALKIEHYYLPDVFQFNVGDEFFHSLLNRCKVVKREETGDNTIIYLSTKSGVYKFKK